MISRWDAAGEGLMRRGPEAQGKNLMGRALLSLVLAVLYLAAAEIFMRNSPIRVFGLRPPSILRSSGLMQKHEAVVAPSRASMPTPDSREALKRVNALFKELAEGKRKRLRAAYYGDSLIEGDHITSSLRRLFQKDLGGRGVGFVRVASPISHYRTSIRQKCGKGWRFTALSQHKQEGPYGVSGAWTMLPADSDESWVEFKGGLGKSKEDLAPAVLYYGTTRRKGGLSRAVTVTCRSDHETKTFRLDGKEPVNRLVVMENSAPRLEMKFSGSGDLPIFGVSFEGEEGFLLDSFPLRGLQGDELASIPAGNLECFQKCLKYDLVILHFGVNVIYPDRIYYESYGKRLGNSLAHLARCFPEATLVLVSAADRGIKTEEGIVSNPHLPFIIEAQRKAATEAGAAFMDLFATMGGEGTVARWAKEEPPLVRKDCTHFSAHGSERIAVMVANFLTGKNGPVNEPDSPDRSDPQGREGAEEKGAGPLEAGQLAGIHAF